MIPSRLGGLPHDNPLRFPNKLLDRFHIQPQSNSQLACIVSAVVWIPSAILALTLGWSYFRGFLFDIAAQSRILLAIPLLIVAEPAIIEHRFQTARLFLTNDLIPAEQASRFEKIFSNFERRRKQRLAHLALALIIYGLVAASFFNMSPGTLPLWCRGTQVAGILSFAGAYYVFFGIPVLVYLVLRWMWEIGLWTLFLRSVSLLDLRLVPSHPDLMAGLSFLETTLRRYLPFAYSVGIIFAGGIANQVLHRDQPLTSFRSIELVAVCFVVLVCAGPLLSFYEVMLKAKRRGTFEYGRFATMMGHELEAKWIYAPTGPTAKTLESPDFSATTDLYSITANVRQIKPFPFGVRSVLRLAVATLVPGIPVAIIAIPFDVLLDKILKLLV